MFDSENIFFVQLIGIAGDVRYEQLRQSVLTAVPYVPHTISLEEVNKVDDILQMNLKAIPAIVVNKTSFIEAHNKIPTADDIIHYFRNYYK